MKKIFNLFITLMFVLSITNIAISEKINENETLFKSDIEYVKEKVEEMKVSEIQEHFHTFKKMEVAEIDFFEDIKAENLSDWKFLIIGVLTLLFEVLIRLYPTTKSLSLLRFVIFLVDKIIPDIKDEKDEKKGILKRFINNTK